LAARRLIAVMLVLLFLSSLAAALAPVDERVDSDSTTTAPLPEPPTERGELKRESLEADAKRPATVRATVGDQLQLRVTAKRPGTIELAGLDADEDVDPDAPALFDVLLERVGRFRVREVESGRVVGLIEVSARTARTGRAEDPARSRS
jgi:hypothetical protein